MTRPDRRTSRLGGSFGLRRRTVTGRHQSLVREAGYLYASKTGEEACQRDGRVGMRSVGYIGLRKIQR